METRRRFFHGRFIKVDIDKILSIHENIYNTEPSFFLYMAGVNEKVVLCEDDYDEPVPEETDTPGEENEEEDKPGDENDDKLSPERDDK